MYLVRGGIYKKGTVMKNGLLEPGPFMTIRVSSRKGDYPSPVVFVDISDENYNKDLQFVHADCGEELTVVGVRTNDPEGHYYTISCEKCGSHIKMYQDVFWGEVSSLAICHERWVAGAYQFVLALFVK